MTKPYKIDPKVSTIRQEDKEKPGDEKRSRAKEKAFAAGDTYTPGSGSADGYKGLVEGKHKASDLGGLSQALNSPKRLEDPRKAYRRNRFMLGDDERASSPSVRDHEDIYVADLEKDIFRKAPGQIEHIKLWVDKYAAQKKVILTIIRETEKSLHPDNMSRMSTDEIRALQKYRKLLEHRLGQCNKQYNEARFYSKWWEESKRKAREAMEAEDT